MAKTPSVRKEWELSFSPSLAQHIGVEGAIVLQRLMFLLSINGGKVIDGDKYIWCTFEEWQKTHFPFWSLSTVKRIFKSLEDGHILEFKQPDGYMSRKKYYRVNEGAYQNLTLESAPEPTDLPIVSNWSLPSCQNESFDQLKLTPSITERSTEKTTGRERKDRGTFEEVNSYCHEQGLPESDAIYMFNKWEADGWMNGNQKVKDWKATIRSWKAANYFPSQKHKKMNGHSKPTPQHTPGTGF